MLFTLRNLGRLEEATIDLGKDLIVLTGPNSTSNVAHAIHGFCHYLASSLLGPVWNAVKQRRIHMSSSTCSLSLSEISMRFADRGPNSMP